MGNLFYAVGYMLLSLWGFVFYHWKWMTFATALWPCLFIIACPFLPESFRWYISKGKFKKGKNAVSKYASHCQVEIPKETIERMVQDSSEAVTLHHKREQVKKEVGKSKIAKTPRLVAHDTQEHVYTIKDLFKTPQIRKLTFKMSYLYFCRFAAYYAAFIIDIEGSRLLVNFLFGLIEFCAPLICMPIINRSFANRSLWCSACFAAMVLTFSLGAGISQGAFDTQDSKWDIAVFVLQLIGAIPAVMVSSFLWTWATELYPTPIRNSAIGIFICIGKLSGIVTSQLFRLNKPPQNLYWVPNFILGILMLIAALISLGVRDTNGLPLVQTIKAAEEMLAKKDRPLKTRDQKRVPCAHRNF